jgi:hypothetical protein
MERLEAADLQRDALRIREALGRLCTRGVVSWWVRDTAEILLALRCVSDRASVNGHDDVEALVGILRELVGRIRHQSHGKILWIVLGLEDDYLQLRAGERRALAGRAFRDGMAPVRADTIRLHHEPAALDRLTEMLLQYERATLDRAAGD